MVVFLHIILSH